MTHKLLSKHLKNAFLHTIDLAVLIMICNQSFVYPISRASVSLVASLMYGVYQFCCPLVAALVYRFGCRPVCMVGALLGASAELACLLAPNIPFITVTHGLMAGLGYGLIHLPASTAG